jgi:hypothetical protein
MFVMGTAKPSQMRGGQSVDCVSVCVCVSSRFLLHSLSHSPSPISSISQRYVGCAGWVVSTLPAHCSTTPSVDCLLYALFPLVSVLFSNSPLTSLHAHRSVRYPGLRCLVFALPFSRPSSYTRVHVPRRQGPRIRRAPWRAGAGGPPARTALLRHRSACICALGNWDWGWVGGRSGVGLSSQRGQRTR